MLKVAAYCVCQSVFAEERSGRAGISLWWMNVAGRPCVLTHSAGARTLCPLPHTRNVGLKAGTCAGTVRDLHCDVLQPCCCNRCAIMVPALSRSAWRAKTFRDSSSRPSLVSGLKQSGRRLALIAVCIAAPIMQVTCRAKLPAQQSTTFAKCLPSRTLVARCADCTIARIV